MKTNSKEVRKQIREHIMDNVTDGEGNNYQTFEEAKKRLLSEFHRVANYPNNLQRFPNNQDRFSDYLQGIPFNFEYSYWEIAKYLNSLGINPTGKEYDSGKSVKLYHYLIWRELI